MGNQDQAKELLARYEEAKKELTDFYSKNVDVIDRYDALSAIRDEAEQALVAEVKKNATPPEPGQKQTFAYVGSSEHAVIASFTKVSPTYSPDRLPPWALTPGTVKTVSADAVEAIAKSRGKGELEKLRASDAYNKGGWKMPSVSIGQPSPMGKK